LAAKLALQVPVLYYFMTTLVSIRLVRLGMDTLGVVAVFVAIMMGSLTRHQPSQKSPLILDTLTSNWTGQMTRCHDLVCMFASSHREGTCRRQRSLGSLLSGALVESWTSLLTFPRMYVAGLRIYERGRGFCRRPSRKGWGSD